MGKIVPQSPIGKIEFYENHVADWAAKAVAIGTTAGLVTTLATQTEAARAAYQTHLLAQEQSRAATQNYYTAVREMNGTGTDIIQQVKAKAATDGDDIYTLALLPVPATPGPVPAPGTPTDFKVTLNPDGSLRLKWKCPNPAGGGGTIYQIARRIGAGGDFAAIGVSGKRTFLDATIPAGSASVTYLIVAVRSTAAGVAAEFTVNLGVSPSGTATASITPRIAA